MAKWTTSSAVVGIVTFASSLAAGQQRACPTGTSPNVTPRTMTASQMQQAMQNFGAPTASSFTIALDIGPGLANNPAAQAAVRRAADQWAGRITNRTRVRLRFDLAALGPNVLGQAVPVNVLIGYNELRAGLVAAAQGESDDGIVAALPFTLNSISPIGQAPVLTFAASKANLKAIGFQGLDLFFGANDTQITFTTDLPFDFDNRDGVQAGFFDFESVVAHEIGHALGFFSGVDVAVLNILTPLDAFRFELGAGRDPANAIEFFFFPRSFRPGVVAKFDDIGRELELSSGVAGDGRQASHWKDDALTGFRIGVMDPTFGTEDISRVNNHDLRAIDVIGYKVNPAP